MRRSRLRLSGALLLGTLLLSFAEAAWAATCDPAMADMSGPGMAEMAESAMAGMAGMPETPSGHDGLPGQGRGVPAEDDSACPFALAGGVGCAVTLSLPAETTRVNEPPHVRTLSHRSAEGMAPHLQIHAIFHPPKA